MFPCCTTCEICGRHIKDEYYNEHKERHAMNNKMLPFYFIDGPLDGQILEQKDFRPMYFKYTYGLLLYKSDNVARVYCDVAVSESFPPKTLPKEAYKNVVKEFINGEVFEVDEKYYEQLELIAEGAVLKRVDTL